MPNKKEEMLKNADAKGMPGGKPKMNKGMLKRLIVMLFKFYPVLVPVILFCIAFSAIISSVPAVFMQKVIAVIEKYSGIGDGHHGFYD